MVIRSPMIYVKCKTKGCGLDFATGMNIDKKSFETCTLVDNGHIRPEVTPTSTAKPDYHFK